MSFDTLKTFAYVLLAHFLAVFGYWGLVYPKFLSPLRNIPEPPVSPFHGPGKLDTNFTVREDPSYLVIQSISLKSLRAWLGRNGLIAFLKTACSSSRRFSTRKD